MSSESTHGLTHGAPAIRLPTPLSVNLDGWYPEGAETAHFASTYRYRLGSQQHEGRADTDQRARVPQASAGAEQRGSCAAAFSVHQRGDGGDVVGLEGVAHPKERAQAGHGEEFNDWHVSGRDGVAAEAGNPAPAMPFPWGSGTVLGPPDLPASTAEDSLDAGSVTDVPASNAGRIARSLPAGPAVRGARTLGRRRGAGSRQRLHRAMVSPSALWSDDGHAVPSR